MEWLDEKRSDDPASPDGRRFIALVQKELSDEQIAALDIRDFIAAVKNEDGTWTLLGDGRAPIVNVSDELWEAATVWCARRLMRKAAPGETTFRLFVEAETNAELSSQYFAGMRLELSGPHLSRDGSEA